MPFKRDLGFPPNINYRCLAGEEQRLATIINNQLHDLRKFSDRFENALALFGFSNREYYAIREQEAATDFKDDKLRADRYTVSAWQHLASRDAAMTIWNFGHTGHLIKMNLEKCPTLRPMVRIREMEAAFSLFNRNFPDAKKIRHAVAHPADLHSTPAEARKNSVDGAVEIGGVKVMDGGFRNSVVGGIFNQHVAVTILGRVMSFEFSAESLSTLVQIRGQIYRAFDNAEQKTSALFHEMLKAEKLPAREL